MIEVTTFSKCVLWSAVLGSIFCSLAPATVRAEKPATPGEPAPGYRFSGPYTEDNLTIFLVHGQDQVDPGALLMLDEALSGKQAIVHETGSVQELSVENVSKDKSVFIQAGDIVKGGQQDRVISQNMLLKPNSGKTPIGSFCVEQGRWQKRGKEAVTAFDSSKNKLNSKALKLAAYSDKEQSKVWNQVGEVQRKLSKNTGSAVQAAASQSSLQLSLESKSVAQSTDAYRKKFADLVANNNDAIGYVFAINSELNSAEIYGAHEIFKRTWSKLLDATASEALAEKGQTFTPKAFAETDLTVFLASAEAAPEKESVAAGAGESLKREDAKALFVETRSAPGKGWIHKQYLKK